MFIGLPGRTGSVGLLASQILIFSTKWLIVRRLLTSTIGESKLESWLVALSLILRVLSLPNRKDGGERLTTVLSLQRNPNENS